MKSQFSSLTIGLMISIGIVSQASPSLAELYTKPFTTPKGDGIFTYDSDNNKLIYSIGNQDTPFSSSGEFHWDINTWRGSNYGSFKEENGATGTYYQDFPLGGNPNSSTSGSSTFNFDPATNKITWSQGDFQNASAKYGEFQYNPNTFEGESYTLYKDNGLVGGSWIQFGRTPYQVEIPTTDSSYDPETAITTVYGKFTNSDNRGGYFQQISIPTYTGSNTSNEIETGVPGLIERKFTTPQGDGIYTYDINRDKTTWLLGDPNGSFSSSGVLEYDQNTSQGTIDVTYKDNGTIGGYSVQFGSNSEAVPEPDSTLLNTLALGVLLGAGLRLKRSKSQSA